MKKAVQYSDKFGKLVAGDETPSGRVAPGVTLIPGPVGQRAEKAKAARTVEKAETKVAKTVEKADFKVAKTVKKAEKTPDDK